MTATRNDETHGQNNLRPARRFRGVAVALAARVAANLSGKIVIKDLAASLDVSVGHFCRAFKRTFGVPARIWIRHRRIVGDTPSSWRQTRHAAIEERVTELAYPGKAKPTVIEKARRLGRC